MKSAFFTTECEPYAKTGGLGDVSSALPAALAGLGCDIRIFLPLYKQVEREKYKISLTGNPDGYDIIINNKSHHFAIYRTTKEKVKIYFIESKEYFDRDTIYTNNEDEDERYILFQYAALKSLEILDFKPDIIHCNDWQTSLIPEILNINFRDNDFYKDIKTLLTIHNLAYQGSFPRETTMKAGLPVEKFFGGGPYEMYGNFNFLKIGIEYADSINTVSPQYAKEILTKDFGAGLEGVLATRADDLTGILNGIDIKEWSPETDKYLATKYNFNTINVKSFYKNELLRRSYLDHNSDELLIGIVSRFVWQKGFDIFDGVMDNILSKQIKMVILGDGEKKYREFFKKYMNLYPEKLYLHFGYDNELAHLITAGCDAFLMPSRYEPCGLNQMYSLKFGTVPIVRKTGGLADTVKDVITDKNSGNGFVFEKFEPRELDTKIDSALHIFNNDKPKWQLMQKRGMEMDFTWSSSAEKYLSLYRNILAKPHRIIP
jgi:starch synthase